MKIVAAFGKPEEAHLLRSHLEGNGISAFVRDDHTVTADWALSNAIGGVKIEVADEDYEKARAFLAEFNPPPEPNSETKAKKHGFGRYFKIFCTSFIVLFGFLAWRWGVRDSHDVTMAVISSFPVSVCVAAFCAILDL